MRKSSKGSGQWSGVGGQSKRIIKNLLFILLLVAGHWSPVTIVHAQPPSPFAVDKLSGQKAPDFTLKDINGNSVSLSSFKGKVVLLNFWATWCPPCKAEIPSMNKLHQKLKNRGFVMLAVSTDRAVIDVKDFLKTTPVNFPVVVDYNLNVSRSLYRVFMMPTTFLIDRKGVIVEKYFGEQDWTEPEIIKEIEALL